MTCNHPDATICLLLSGGLDSCILLGHLLRQNRCVQPLYIRSGLAWQREELRAAQEFLRAVASPRLDDLIVLDLPLGDLYEDHWSVTGARVPDAASADNAVYLPGRNVLLLVKAVLWCGLHGVGQLALAVLGSNPFADATAEFFAEFEAVLDRATGGRVGILRPFAALSKRDVMRLGQGLPLGLTFSCIAPVDGLHCGRCNKCAERIAAFHLVGADDPTQYANMKMAVAKEGKDEGLRMKDPPRACLQIGDEKFPLPEGEASL